MDKKIEVFHTGFLTIPKPDVHYGRSNADFGQGFYVTPDGEFAARWAKLRKDRQVVVNRYSLDLSGLKVHRFERNEDWFRYIFRNRRSYEDELDVDVVIGPIANDTIYDTLGIFTSGFLSDELALELLSTGPKYVQIALKTEKAASRLTWTGSTELSEDAVQKNRELLKEEEEVFLAAIAEKMS